MSSKKLLWPLMCILVIFSMIAAGCAPAATPVPATEAPVVATEAPAAPQVSFTVPPAGQEIEGCHDREIQRYHGHSGWSVCYG